MGEETERRPEQRVENPYIFEERSEMPLISFRAESITLLTTFMMSITIVCYNVLSCE